MSKIKSCPNKPNCVSSIDDDLSHKVEPLNFFNDLQETKHRIIQVMNLIPRSRLIKSDGNYFCFEVKSAFFRFIDIVEFEIDAQKKIVQIKSASQMGHRDFGVNKNRTELIRKKWL